MAYEEIFGDPLADINREAGRLGQADWTPQIGLPDWLRPRQQVREVPPLEQTRETEGPRVPRPEDYRRETEGPRVPRSEDYPPYQAPGEVIPRYAEPVGTPSGRPNRDMELAGRTPLNPVQQANLLRDQAARMAWGGQMSPDAALRAYGRALLDPSVKLDPMLTPAQAADAALRQAQNDVSVARLSQPEELQLQRLRMAQAVVEDQHASGMLTDQNAQILTNMIGARARPLVQRSENLPMATMQHQGLMLQHMMAQQESILQQNLTSRSRTAQQQIQVLRNPETGESMGPHLISHRANGEMAATPLRGHGELTLQQEMAREDKYYTQAQKEYDAQIKEERDWAKQPPGERGARPPRPPWMPQIPRGEGAQHVQDQTTRDQAIRSRGESLLQEHLRRSGISPRNRPRVEEPPSGGEVPTASRAAFDRLVEAGLVAPISRPPRTQAPVPNGTPPPATQSVFDMPM